MRGSYTLAELFRFLLKKIYIVIIATVVLAVGFGVLKSSGEAAPKIVYGQLIQFQNHAKYVDPISRIEQYQPYTDIWFRDSVICNFVATADEKFDMDKFDSSWKGMNISEKEDWIRDAFKCEQIQNTANYEITFSATVPNKYKQYCLNQAPEFVKSFLDYANQSVKFLSKQSQYSIVDKTMNSSEDASEHFSKKYGVVGGFVGALVGVLVVLIMFLYSGKVVSKSIILSKYNPDFIEGKNTTFDTVCYMMRQARKYQNTVFTVCTTQGKNQDGIAPIVRELSKLNIRLAVANMNGKDYNLDKYSNVTILPSETVDKLLCPTSVSDALSEIKSQYDYILLVSPTPAENAITLEQADLSACTVFVEKVDRSMRQELHSSLNELNKQGICVAVAWM